MNNINEVAEKFGFNKDLLINKVLTLIASRLEDDATELIVEYIEKRNVIKTTSNDLKNEIWFYEEGIYKPNGKSKIQEITRTILGKVYTSQRVNKVICKIEADTLIEEDVFFNTNYIGEIPIINGILNLKTRELKPFDPKKIFFNKLPIKYNIKAKCDCIDKFFKDTLQNPEDSLKMYELLGYCLYTEHFIEKAFMFVGDGRNGKGKTLNLIKKFLGVDNYCNIPLSQMKYDNSAICELFGKLANLSGDLDKTALKETGLFKELTGRDTITAKRKYLTDLSFTSYCKHVFSANTLPQVYDTSLGFWSRWILFNFPYTFVSLKEYNEAKNKDFLKIRDVNIIDKITHENELSGLLNKALDGLHRLFENEDFSKTKGSEEIKNIWIRKADSFLSFCMDNIIESDEGYISKKDLRNEYRKYTKKHKTSSVSDKSIKLNLELNYGVTDIYKTDFEGNREFVWEGISWKKKEKKNSETPTLTNKTEKPPIQEVKMSDLK